MFIPFNVISSICYFNCYAFCLCPQLNGSSFDTLSSKDGNLAATELGKIYFNRVFWVQQLIWHLYKLLLFVTNDVTIRNKYRKLEFHFVIEILTNIMMLWGK